jgi:hypothetical protein
MTQRQSGLDRFGPTLLRTVMAAAALAALAAPAQRADAAEPPPSPAGATRSLAVSVPPEPVPVQPDQDATMQLRITNPGNEPVPVTIANRGLTLGDEGHVTLTDQPDPLWADRVEFPPGPYTIAAHGFQDLNVTVHTPPSLAPDLYFLGFAVTPLPGTASGVHVINQIGGFITIDVPGPRNRHLDADLKLPGWSLGGLRLVAATNINATLHVANTGTAAVRFWGETDTTTTGGTPNQNQIPKSLAPTGHTRTFIVTTKTAWPIGFATIQIRLVYPTTTETTTTDIVLTRKVLVIHPIALAALAALTLFATLLIARRRNRDQPAPSHQTHPQPQDNPHPIGPRPGGPRPVPLSQR